jgi:hypothetical protein
VDPQDDARLVRAFVNIKDPAIRQKIIDMVEEAARPVSLPRVDPRGHPGRRIGPASAHRSQATRHVVNGVPFRAATTGRLSSARMRVLDSGRIAATTRLRQGPRWTSAESA